MEISHQYKVQLSRLVKSLHFRTFTETMSVFHVDQVPSNDYEEEYLWSCEFSGASKEYSWCPEDPADQDDEDAEDPSVKPGHRLLLKSAVLMPSAKAGEVSVVQVETEGYNNTKV